MLSDIEKCLANGESFVIETTLSTKSYVHLVHKAKKLGYEAILIYFWLEGPSHAIERVARRVRQGGHYIPNEVVIRRYWKGIKNLKELFIPIVDKWVPVDNSDYTEGHPLRIAEKLPDGNVIVENSDIWLKIKDNENN